MARTRFRNPIGFLPTPVTLIIAITYITLTTGLLYVQHVVPPAPKKDAPVAGINITEAWRDLQTLSSGYHPLNSRRNDVVRNWLLNRVENILSANNASFTTVKTISHLNQIENSDDTPVVVFNDVVSNATFFSEGTPPSVYFEGSNIMVYIRGFEDDSSGWWQNQTKRNGPRGVLVNAHFDSVSSGLGATDDGVGVVTVLQLIKYFSKKGNQPKRGLVALLNNGEEDFLNGAQAFTRHPISKFPNTFLNLEGAGAGGRATLFRSTDAEVTKYYGNSPHPFGTAVSGDAFERGLIRSQTDYVVFNGDLGMRGLDVAFYEPRAKYHTTEDSARETSRASLWHMLSAALATTRGLTSDTDSDFKSGSGSTAVYFDVFGGTLGLMNLESLFGLSVTLLVVAPIVMVLIAFVLWKKDKAYLFATKQESDPLNPQSQDDTVTVHFGGWKGFTRYPIAFISASVAVVALAYLVAKVNPFIVYSSQYAVWSMMLSAWFIVVWFFLRGADVMRPSALHRAHALGWIFFISWVLLIFATALENNFKMAGGYFVPIYFAGSFVALAISYLEFLGLRTRAEFVELSSRAEEQGEGDEVPGSSQGEERQRRSRATESAADEPEPSETTSLLGKRGRATFNLYARTQGSDITQDHLVTLGRRTGLFGEEQAWSGDLPSWLWTLEFFAFAPFALIFVGPIALLTTTSLHQTLADGSSAILIYNLVAVLSILLLMPASPFIHRVGSRLPTFLFLVFVGTLIYNLLAFPFSAQNRLKVFFYQDVNIDTGVNRVYLTGLDGYIQRIVEDIPSAAGEQVDCKTGATLRKDLTTCSWHGLAPNVVPSDAGAAPPTPAMRYASWLSVNATREGDDKGAAKVKISGAATRACRLFFDPPVVDFYVKGAADERGSRVPPGGTNEIRLWHREWDTHWTVHVKWNATASAAQGEEARAQPDGRARATRGLDGTAMCLWSDANELGTIPAYDELRLHMPVWSIVTKAEDGLVRGSKSFLV